MATKVLLVVTKSNYGGAQRYVHDLATNLPKDRFEVTVAFGPAPDGKPGRLAKVLAQAGIRILLVPELSRDVNPLGDMKALGALARLFKKEKPDVVHLNSSKAGGLGALAGRIAGVKHIIFTSHGLPFDEDRGTLSRFAITIATWMTVLLSHHTIAIANDTADRLKKLPFLPKRVALIHNGILTPRFLSPEDARRDIRTLDASIPSDAKWIGMIGELHVNKDYATAIEMVGFLESDAHLIVIGDGEEKEKLSARAEDAGVASRVHFLGFVPEAAQYLRAFDAFLLTSQKEGLPYVLMEAGYAYIPAVASDTAGVRDIILHNFTGLTVQSGAARAFSEAIEKVLGDATLARSLSDELLKRIQKVFSLDQMVEKTAKLYTE
ncbi:glycosyltransferase [bacterium]|nr:glycosyltransferase [bacterium]